MSNEVDTSDELLLAFIDESVDGLRELPHKIALHQQNPGDGSHINAIFRSVHSIKGNAGFFGLKSIKTFAHAVENRLDDVRNGVLPLLDDLLRCFVESFDLLEGMLAEVSEGGEDRELGPVESTLLANLEQISAQHAAPNPEELKARLQSEVTELVKEMATWNTPQAATWCERLQPFVIQETTESDLDSVAQAEVAPEPLRPEQLILLAANGNEPYREHLAPLGNLFEVTAKSGYEPALGEAFKAAANQFADWAKTNQQAALAEAFDLAVVDFRTLDECPIDVDSSLLELVWDRLREPLNELLAPQLLQLAEATTTVSKDEQPITKAPERASGNKSESAAEITEVSSVGLPTAEPSLDSPKPTTEFAQPDPKPSGASPETNAADNAAKTRFVRVKEQNLDDFLDGVASLYISGERLKNVHSRLAATNTADMLVEELRQINTTLMRQTGELQKHVASVRRIPARGLLSKFPRMARGLAGSLGKQLVVEMSGEDTEIDKSLVEDLDAPLTHMIRNVCDHGVESPEDRKAAGKSPSGTLKISCTQTKSHVVIHVSDDGRGIDPEKIGQKAVEKGAITASQLAAMTMQEKVNLVFHPGFSTAAEITDVSGRGVGLDVVRTTLRELDGELDVESQVGIGTHFTLKIPIRNAVVVIDGLLVEQSDERFLIPFSFIREIVELESHDITHAQGCLIASLRGEPYGAERLSSLLGLPDRDFDSGLPAEEADESVRQGVLVHHQSQSVCLMVDRVLGQQKVVVNNIGEMLTGASKFSGVAQLGGGDLTLVLSVPDLMLEMRGQNTVEAIALA